jgi:creatinine amidohydrolase
MLDARAATWPEVKAAIEQGCLAIMAFGAQEQHGPHCPLSTDTLMAAGLARQLAERLDALLLPPLPYGETWNNSRFPGTVSISFSTLKSLVLDIGISLKKSGVRGFILVNGHFGNRAPIELACRELKTEHGLAVLQIDYPGLDRIAQEVCESQPAGQSFYHADESETSVVLALEPEMVKMECAKAEYPQFPVTFGSEPLYLDEFCASSVFGDPTRASADKGEKILDGLVEESLKVIGAFMASLPPLQPSKQPSKS